MSFLSIILHFYQNGPGSNNYGDGNCLLHEYHTSELKRCLYLHNFLHHCKSLVTRSIYRYFLSNLLKCSQNKLIQPSQKLTDHWQIKKPLSIL